MVLNGSMPNTKDILIQRIHTYSFALLNKKYLYIFCMMYFLGVSDQEIGKTLPVAIFGLLSRSSCFL